MYELFDIVRKRKCLFSACLCLLFSSFYTKAGVEILVPFYRKVAGNVGVSCNLGITAVSVVRKCG